VRSRDPRAKAPLFLSCPPAQEFCCIEQAGGVGDGGLLQDPRAGILNCVNLLKRGAAPSDIIRPASTAHLTKSQPLIGNRRQDAQAPPSASRKSKRHH
jgi:hypothetical protein